MTRVRVTPERFPEALRRLGEHIEDAVFEGYYKAAVSARGYAERLTVSRRARAQGVYLASWRVETDRSKNLVALANTAAHAIFAEEGRRPGKRPPLLPILQWVLIKGLAKRRRGGFRVPTSKPPTAKTTVARPRLRKKGAFRRRRGKLDALTLAYLIARKIGKDGTEGHHVMADTVERLERLAPIAVERSVKRALRRPPR